MVAIWDSATGIDYENEQDEQNIQMYDSAVFVPATV